MNEQIPILYWYFDERNDSRIHNSAEAYQKAFENGFMLFGVPQGDDCLVWNAHRIYGEKRLPLLLKGWNVEAVLEQEPPAGQPLGTYHVQPLMVLRK